MPTTLVPHSGSDSKVLVVVSYYHRRPKARSEIRDLMASMTTFTPGHGCDITIVENTDRNHPSKLPKALTRYEHRIRPNIGRNIGAWDYAWRNTPGYTYYLFTKQETRVVRPNWVAAFVNAAADTSIGLLGESINQNWNKPWDEIGWRATIMRDNHFIDNVPAPTLECYFNYFQKVGIPRGHTGTHVQSLIWFARDEVLRQLNGFPIGKNKGECIAAEIGVSKRVEALGLRVKQVSQTPFYYITQDKWT